MKQFIRIARGVSMLCGSFLFAAMSFAQALPQPDSVAVSLYGDALAKAESRLVGRGLALDESTGRGRAATLVSPCGGGSAEIVWREVRRDTDPEGGTHVFYRQYVAGEGIDAELFGSEIGVHRTAGGKLLGIGGRQFESVTLSGCAAFDAARATQVARDRILMSRGQYGQHRRWSMNDASADRSAQTKLKLVQVDGTFGPAWFTTGEDADGEPHAVVIDAQDGRLLAIDGTNPGNRCTPNQPQSFVNAPGVPVRHPEIVNLRQMKANVAPRNDTPEMYTHEGVWIPSGMPLTDQPPIRHMVYHGMPSGDGHLCAGKYYTLFPLKVNPAVNCCSPAYEDSLQQTGYSQFFGRAAGDALWHTYKTMFAFRSLGRKGWDNANGDAVIVVNSGGQLGSEQGEFMQSASSHAPANSVRIGPHVAMYPLAAALDLVAHEWGHGVIFTSSNITRSTEPGKQLHEGFADVIAMLVEKRSHVSGNGLEQSSDWRMHEDAAVSGYARGAEDDDADGTPGHFWVGPNGSHKFDDQLHAGDVPIPDGQIAAGPHVQGNMLNVVHRIIASGGLNPVCARKPWLAGCESSNSVTGYLGASKAGSLLFYAIQFTVTSNTTWTDVGDRVVEAAFQRFNNCAAGSIYNAAGDQDAVIKAFRGIGYPSRYTTPIRC